MRARKASNFPGDSECYAGLVQADGSSHVCLVCAGNGCRPSRVSRQRLELFQEKRGELVLQDQYGNVVFVNLATGTVHVTPR